MAKRKFKIGDYVILKRVKGFKIDFTIQEQAFLKEKRIGKIAKITSIDPYATPFVYSLNFKENPSWWNYPRGYMCTYSSRELELVIANTADLQREEILGKIKQLWERQEYVRNAI